jgi:ParB family chromosome partitioning protein
LVREATPDQSLEMALVENLQREDLNAIEAAEAFDRLVAEFGLKHEEVARRTGKDRVTITNLLRLLKLPAEVQELVRDGKLSGGHAKALLGLASAEEQRRAATQLVAQDLSVRAAERLVGRLAAGEAQPRKSKVQRLDPNIRAALADLERLLGTRVRLTGGGRKGTLIFEYYSPKDLMRIYDAIANQDSVEV